MQQPINTLESLIGDPISEEVCSVCDVVMRVGDIVCRAAAYRKYAPFRGLPALLKLCKQHSSAYSVSEGYTKDAFHEMEHI